MKARKARVLVYNMEAGILTQHENETTTFTYHSNYNGPPVSLTMPTKNKHYTFQGFPPFFEGLLPEGMMLEALLRTSKLDRKDYLGQLLQVGHDLVGAVNVQEISS